MNKEQQATIKLCVQNGLSKGKTIEMISNAQGESLVKKASYKWYKRFEEGLETLGDNKRRSSPETQTSSDVAAIKHLQDKENLS